MACLITAGSGIVNHAKKTITYAYTTSGTKVSLVPTGAGDTVDLADVTAAMLAIYAPLDTEGIYDAPAAGNLFAGATIISVVGSAKGFVATYAGELTDNYYIVAALGYDVYDDTPVTPVEFATWEQVVFNSAISAITPVQLAAWNTSSAVVLTAVNAVAGSSITPTKKPESCMLIIFNSNSGSTSHTLTIHAGDSRFSAMADVEIAVAKGAYHCVILESAMFKFLIRESLKGKFYLSGNAELKVAFVQMI